MAEKTFTLNEAQTLLPILESLLTRAIEGKREVQRVEGELDEITRRIFLNGGTMVNVVAVGRLKDDKERAVQQVADAITEIDATGVQVKDLDIGLLDFPCVVDDQVILLCWKLGEKSITHWHGTTEGFAGRKPIDEKIANAKSRKRPN